MFYRLIRLLFIVTLLVLAVFYLPRWWQEYQREQAAASLRDELAAADLAQLEAALDGERLRLSGKVAVSAQKARALHLAARHFEPETIDDAVQVAPPVSPYRFTAQHDDGVLSLQGYMPGAEARAALLDWLAERRLRVGQNRLRLAEGAPVDWPRTVRTALEALQAVGDGDVEIAWRSVSLRGKGTAPRARVRARKLLEPLRRQGYETSFRLVPVLGCIDRVQALAVASPLHFEAGNAVITPDSFRFLDELAEVAGACPDVRFEVHGHTDDRGDPAANLALSQQRAEAVVRALVERGVPAGQFVPIGHGAAMPIADNSTERGRARNRRIEFTVKGATTSDKGP